MKNTIKEALLSHTLDSSLVTMKDVCCASYQTEMFANLSSGDMKNLYEKGESLIRDLCAIRKTMSHEDFQVRYEHLQKLYPTYTHMVDRQHEEIIQSHSYPLNAEKKKDYLSAVLQGKNIQAGGQNAHGVYELPSGFVAVVKSLGSYVHELPLRTLMLAIHRENIPAVIDVFIHENKTYKIMQKATGIQLDKLSQEQIDAIPQEHYDQFIADIGAIENAGMMIDPSKESNFFYDPRIGFSIIDLGVNNATWSAFSSIKNLMGGGRLDEAKVKISLAHLKK